MIKESSFDKEKRNLLWREVIIVIRNPMYISSSLWVSEPMLVTWRTEEISWWWWKYVHHTIKIYGPLWRNYSFLNDEIEIQDFKYRIFHSKPWKWKYLSLVWDEPTFYDNLKWKWLIYAFRQSDNSHWWTEYYENFWPNCRLVYIFEAWCKWVDELIRIHWDYRVKYDYELLRVQKEKLEKSIKEREEQLISDRDKAKEMGKQLKAKKNWHLSLLENNDD